MVGMALSTGSARTNKVLSSGKPQDQHQEPVRAEASSFGRTAGIAIMGPGGLAMQDTKRLNGRGVRTVGDLGPGKIQKGQSPPTGSN